MAGSVHSLNCQQCQQSLLSSKLDINVSMALQLSPPPTSHTDAVLAVVLNIQREHKVLMKDDY